MTTGTQSTATSRQQTTALVLATVAFTTNFWAWGLLSPLAPEYREILGLSALQTSVLVATPVLLGSVFRIPVGALTDRFGGRAMFTGLSLVVIAPLLFLAAVESYPALLVGGFVLGLSGASFAIGIPFVSRWYPPQRRGYALGIYGVGNVGTAIAGFTSPPLAASFSRSAPFLLVAVVMLCTAAVFYLFGRDAPGRAPDPTPFLQRIGDALRLRVTADLAALYAITFGGFVAFGVYLPTYLTQVYALEIADAGARAAGFIVLATFARPVGGWLSDRVGGGLVLVVALAVVAAGAAAVAFTPGIVIATVAFLSMAAALGVGNGAVFALVGTRAPATKVGAVTGFVGAAGGLGGFFPPLVMGAVFEATGSYAIGLLLLCLTALAGMTHSYRRFVGVDNVA